MWPKLLGSVSDYQSRSGRVQLVDKSFDYRQLIDDGHRDKEQVAVDIDRSLINIVQLKDWTEKQLDSEREIISNHIMAVVSQHPEFHYFQGFHDVVSVFCLVLGSWAKGEEGQQEGEGEEMRKFCHNGSFS